jgi:hypothetical protein
LPLTPASVESNGTILFQSDNAATNTIVFQEGADQPQGSGNPAIWGAYIADTASGETVTPGTGCVQASGNDQAVYCTSGSTYLGVPIVIDANGATDSVTNEINSWHNQESCSCDGSFGSITINAGNGNDTIQPLAGNDASGSTVTVNAGNGNDNINLGYDGTNSRLITITAGTGNDTINGGDSGTPKNITVGAGTATISGGYGDDTITSAGDDNITAGNGVNTITSTGTGSITAGNGPETINTYGGKGNTVECNILGADTVTANQYDTVNTVDCAKVTVLDYPSGCPVGDTGTAPNCGPPGITPPPVKFKVTVSASSTQKIVKQKGLAASVECNLYCYAYVRGGVAINGSKKLLLTKPAGPNLAAHRTYKITVKFSKSQLKTIEKAFAKHKKVTAEILVEADDSAGKQLTVTRSFTVKH